MSRTTISLNGTWRLTGKGADGASDICIDASVPGHVHNDLLLNGLIEDPFWRDNAEKCQWIEERQWTFSREFEVPLDADLSWAEIDFRGLDTYSEITLNGHLLGKTDNMFVPHSFDAGKLLKHGANLIEVRFQPVSKGIGNKPVADFESCFSSDRVYTRRMQCTYSWDWVHRFVSYGIWQPVELQIYDSAKIDSVYVHTRSIDETSAAVQIASEITVRNSEPVRLKVQISDPQGNCVWSENTIAADGTNQFTADISNPELWWPAGSGNQPLYTVSVELLDPAGSVLDNNNHTFGIRTVRLEQINDTPGSEYERITKTIRQSGSDRSGDIPGKSYSIIVNGKHIFCKGGNWVPCDPFPGRIKPEKYDRLIKLVRDGNMNCLRSWGGGIYEPEAFWNACDKYGVMITQDFLMACARYPENDADFMEQLRKEFPVAIRMLRNHPSLVLWAGDNELAMNADFDDPNASGKKTAEKISGPLCRVLDPSRPFVPTSPFGGRPNNCATIGDVHLSAWYDPDFITGKLDDYRAKIGNTVGRFISESAVPGAPPMRSLKKFMSAADIADPEGRMWNYHTKDNPYNGIEDPYMTHYRMLEHTAYELFGETNDPDIKVNRMEYAHYEWIRLQVETARRNKWYCSGILFWMYNDCWPASGWSIVDFYGYPKAGWYAMKDRSKPLIVSIEETEDNYRIWVCNDLLNDAQVYTTLYTLSFTGKRDLYCETNADVCANSSMQVLTVPKAEMQNVLNRDSLLICDMKSAAGSDRAWLYGYMPREMQLPEAYLKTEIKADGSSGNIVISTDNYARVVTLDADLDFSDNYFDMLPGETRIITWSDPCGNNNAGNIRISCWNQK